jgi:hypothetical protein
MPMLNAFFVIEKHKIQGAHFVLRVKIHRNYLLNICSIAVCYKPYFGESGPVFEREPANFPTEKILEILKIELVDKIDLVLEERKKNRLANLRKNRGFLLVMAAFILVTGYAMMQYLQRVEALILTGQ